LELQPGGKISEPAWWIEKNGKSTPKTSIRADLCGILENLLLLGKDVFVPWAAENLDPPIF